MEQIIHLYGGETWEVSIQGYDQSWVCGDSKSSSTQTHPVKAFPYFSYVLQGEGSSSIASSKAIREDGAPRFPLQAADVSWDVMDEVLMTEEH